MQALMKHILFLSALILSVSVSLAQDKEQRTSNVPSGGKWSTSGTMTHFSSVGQLGIASDLLSADSSWSGSVGFVIPTFSLEPNQPPVAVAVDQEIFYEVGQSLVLEGFDPEDDPIKFEIVTNPKMGTLTPVTGAVGEFVFAPNSGLLPDTDYSDMLEFKVVETGGQQKSSNTAQLKFKFKVEDTPHHISALTFDNANGSLSLSWLDTIQNASYGVALTYYDLSDVNNADFKTLYSESNPITDYSVDNQTVTFDLSVNSETDPYLFANTKIFVAALVTTDNGNSDFTSFVVDNTGGSRTNASSDGLFFAYGSDMTVTENKTVNLSLMAVELGDFSLDETSIEILQVASQGTLGSPKLIETATNTKTWQLSFTSTKDVGGLDSVQFRIYQPDRQLFDTSWAKIQIRDVNDPPKITRIADQTTEEEMPLVVDLKYTDPDNAVDILVESNEASNVAASYADGQITITPGKDYSGLVSVNVIITEKDTKEAYVAYDRFDVTVEAVNDPPVVTAIKNQVIDEDNALTLALSATDVDAKIQLFDYSVELSEPSKFSVTIDDNNATITPKANINGSFTVSVYADDRQGTATSKSEAQTFILDITPVNDAPEVIKTFASQKIVSGFPAYTLNMAAYYNDVEDGAALTYTATGNSKVALTFDGAVMTVTPAADFSSVEDVTIEASDGELSASQTVTFVAVQESANITVANAPGTLSFDEDSGIQTFDLSNVFSDQNNTSATFTFDLLGGNFLDVSIDENTGSLTVTAPENYNGTEDLYLVGTTGGQSGYTTFKITVNPVNDAPVISDLDNQVTQEDIGVSGLFVSTTDVDNAFTDLSLSFKSSNPDLIPESNISGTATTDGYLMAIIPAANQNGTAVVKVFVSDGSLKDSTQLIVTVQAVNDKPTVAVTTIDGATEDKTYTLDVTTLFSDVENDPLTYEATALPDWATFDNDLVVGTPTNADVGDWTLSVKANDGNGGVTSATYDLSVTNVNDAPELLTPLSDITAFQAEEWKFNFPVSNFSDVDAGDNLTYSFEKYPSWASVSGDVLSGTPSYEEIGDYKMILLATDEEGAQASDTVMITVVFTIYDVEVTLDVQQDCSDGKRTVTASGAFNYNWYNSNGDLIGTKQKSLTLEAGDYSIEGVDENDHTTPKRVDFTLDVCEVLGIETPELSIYPNPTSDWLYIQNVKGNLTLKIFDTLGKTYDLEVQTTDAKGVRVDMTMLPTGMYFIRTNQDEKIRKVIKRD